MTFYKATRTNGTDFRTGKVRYDVGATVRPLPHHGRPLLCGPGMLHAATVPTETLSGGWWPCRLFEVEGKPIAGLDDKHPHKAGFAELTVVRQLDAHLVFGPQGQEVVALIHRARRLTRDEVRALAADRNAAWYSAWGVAQDAWDAAWTAARAAARTAAYEVARDDASEAAMDATSAAPWDDAAAAAAAAGDAAAALVVRDLLQDEHFDCLYGPWRDVIGPEGLEPGSEPVEGEVGRP